MITVSKPFFLDWESTAWSNFSIFLCNTGIEFWINKAVWEWPLSQFISSCSLLDLQKKTKTWKCDWCRVTRELKFIHYKRFPCKVGPHVHTKVLIIPSSPIFSFSTYIFILFWLSCLMVIYKLIRKGHLPKSVQQFTIHLIFYAAGGRRGHDFTTTI